MFDKKIETVECEVCGCLLFPGTAVLKSHAYFCKVHKPAWDVRDNGDCWNDYKKTYFKIIPEHREEVNEDGSPLAAPSGQLRGSQGKK